MSLENNVLKKSTNDYAIINAEKRGKLIISDDIERQIDTLHAYIGSCEWSGVLLYDIEGDINNPESINIVIKGIFPADIGTAAYTEYSFDEHIMKMYDMYPEALVSGWKLGHCHSHHVMQAYFSGTDLSELRDNTPNHAFYVSLIVNIKKEYCAKICVMGEKVIEENSNITLNGIIKDKFKFKPIANKRIEKVVYTVDLDIVMPENTYFKHIVSLKETKAVKNFQPHWENSINDFNSFNDNLDYPNQLSLFDKQTDRLDGLKNRSFNKTQPTFNKSVVGSDKIENLLCDLISMYPNANNKSLAQVIFMTEKEFKKMDEVEKDIYIEQIDENLLATIDTYWDGASSDDSFCEYIADECINKLKTYKFSEMLDSLIETFELVKL